MNPWLRNLLCGGGGGGGGGAVLPPTGRTMLANLTSSLILDEGTGDPTWSRATKAWGFNELGYLEELASGCAFFGGARLVRNFLTYSQEFDNAAWTKRGAATITANATTAPDGTITADLVTGLAGVGTNDLFQNNSTLPSGSIVAPSFYIKRVSTTGTLRVSNPANSSNGRWNVNLSLLSDNWERITLSHPAVTVAANFIGNGGGDGIIFDCITGAPISFYLWGAQIANVTGYDTSYIPEYVSVGVESSPYFGAGINGAKYFETDWQGAPIAAANLLRVRREASAINNLLHSRDLSNAAWSTKTNITAAKTATGLDGIANTATTLTATAADAIILQPISLASAARCASAYVKRRTGTGTISFTQDGGSTWTDITAQINGSTWSRVEITSTLANPSVGFKISTSGDAIDVDCVQNEAGAVATSPIVTTTTAITRNADSLSYQTAGNIDFAVGTVYGEMQTSNKTLTRKMVDLGTAYSGVISNSVSTWLVFDGTTVITKTGLSDITTAKRKRCVSWGPAGLSATGDGLAPEKGAFSGTFTMGASITIGSNTNGYIGPVAIYNYQMTDAELQALTT